VHKLILSAIFDSDYKNLRERDSNRCRIVCKVDLHFRYLVSVSFKIPFIISNTSLLIVILFTSHIQTIVYSVI
jgi:hypothetical protein